MDLLGPVTRVKKKKKSEKNTSDWKARTLEERGERPEGHDQDDGAREAHLHSSLLLSSLEFIDTQSL